MDGAWLTFNHTKFPNDTIHRQWYNGKKPVRNLHFLYIPIRSIDVDAFNAEAFRGLRLLKIFGNPLYIKDYAPLNVPHQLLQFDILEASNPHSFPENYLQAAQNLHHFRHDGHTLNRGSLTNLFGLGPLKLLTLQIDCYGQIGNTNFITADNFTALHTLMSLAVRECAIEHIDRGTFDALSKTMMVLNLAGNRFAIIDLMVFSMFLEVATIRGRIDSKALILTQCAVCSDEFYQLQNMTLISFGALSDSILTCRRMPEKHSDQTAWQYYQSLNSSRWAFRPKLYRFVRFQIKFDMKIGHLIVMPAMNVSYRVVIWHMQQEETIPKHFCPNRDGHGLVQYWRIDKRSASIPIVHANSNSIVLACVIMIPSAVKHVIPLQCVAIPARMSSIIAGIAFGSMLVPIVMVIGAIGLMTATLFTKRGRRYARKVCHFE